MLTWREGRGTSQKEIAAAPTSTNIEIWGCGGLNSTEGWLTWKVLNNCFHLPSLRWGIVREANERGSSKKVAREPRSSQGSSQAAARAPRQQPGSKQGSQRTARAASEQPGQPWSNRPLYRTTTGQLQDNYRTTYRTTTGQPIITVKVSIRNK